MIEIFKDIEGFEGLYQVSNMGTVKSLDKMVWNGHSYFFKEGITMKPGKDKDGYLIVGLYKNGKAFMRKVHRLVAQAFISNPSNLPEVNHKKGNKKDNRYFMLEWCDRKYNANHALKTGLVIRKKGKDNPLYGRVGELNPMYGRTGELSARSKKVICITTNECFDSMREASRVKKIANGDISRCCNNKRNYAGKTAEGVPLIWKFKEG